MNTWLAAWLFSLMSSAGVYFFARKAKIPRWDSLMVAIATFASPLFRAISSTNSFVYGIDLIAPAAIYCACRSWRASQPRLRHAAIALFFAGGLVPLLIAVLFSANPMDLEFNGINAYRLVGAMALMVRLSALPKKRDSINWLYAFSWMALTIAVAMMSKLFLGIDSDVFSLGYGLSTGHESGNEGAFFVMGMFRAAIGMFGMFAVSAYYCTVSDKSRTLRLVPLLGAIAGVTIAVLAGSKTSVLIIVVILAVRFLTLSTRAAVTGAALLALFTGFVVSSIDTAQARRFLPNSIMLLLDSRGEDRPTFDLRKERWQECVGSISRKPLLLLGVASSDSIPVDPDGYSTYQPGYYHDEYASIAMLGGFWSLLTYGAGLALLTSVLLSQRLGSPAERFGIVVFAGGIIQGLTVAHLQPGLLYGAAVSAAGAIYGFSCPRLLRSTSAARAISLQPVSDNLNLEPVYHRG